MKLMKVVVLLFSLSMAIFAGCGNDPFAEPPLHQATIDGDIDEVKQLLSSGVDVNFRSKTGATALHWAAFKGKYEVGLYLIKNGADVNALTDKGATPLRLATTHKKKKLIALLKQYGGR